MSALTVLTSISPPDKDHKFKSKEVKSYATHQKTNKDVYRRWLIHP